MMFHLSVHWQELSDLLQTVTGGINQLAAAFVLHIINVLKRILALAEDTGRLGNIVLLLITAVARTGVLVLFREVDDGIVAVLARAAGLVVVYVKLVKLVGSEARTITRGGGRADAGSGTRSLRRHRAGPPALTGQCTGDGRWLRARLVAFAGHSGRTHRGMFTRMETDGRVWGRCGRGILGGMSGMRSLGGFVGMRSLGTVILGRS
mmetsp:Transcript_28475/g.62623  ORF Transcript_28475/g.62623 Transcript_28475/m.62623 type:complete len:207 (+) Transcript_28475:104-724(+)